VTVWHDFHEFWLKAKIPVHIIRYEDICKNAFNSFTELFKFILSVETIEGTLIEKRIELALKEKPPEVYKPRKGQVNGNKEKFTAS